MARRSERYLSGVGMMANYIPSRQMLKSDAGYGPPQDPSDGLCKACDYFVGPNKCEKVMGDIAPYMTCDLWEPQGGPGSNEEMGY